MTTERRLFVVRAVNNSSIVNNSSSLLLNSLQQDYVNMVSEQVRADLLAGQTS
jgi:hypothetical protein